MIERRALVFGRLEEVADEVERLLLGNRAMGGWTLAQVVYHVATSIRLTTLGRAPEVVREPDRGEQIVREQFFRDGRIPGGAEVPLEILVPPPGLDPRAEADRLRRAIGKFMAAPGPFPAHPILGPLTHREWERFHQFHCAHHLSHIAPANLEGCAGEMVI